MNEQSPVFTAIKRVRLAEKLRARGLDVQRIADPPADRRFAPGELFRPTEATKLGRVWLD